MNERIRSALAEAASSLLEEAGQPRPDNVRIAVEHPADPAHGDYSSNIAMQLAKTLRRPPMAIAADLKEKLHVSARLSGLFSRIEAAPPGFLNFYTNWAHWASSEYAQLAAVTSNGMKAVVEHTSINPNKSAHIGHLRNSCIGDTLARMMKRAGYQVEVHNYIDDLGNQLADTVVGIGHIQLREPFARFGDYCWETYARINQVYKNEPELERRRAEVLHELEQGDNNTAWLGLLVAERIVREHVEEMKQFSIGYDVLVWESSIVREGFWERAFELLQATPVFQRETEGKLAGCWVLKQPDAAEEAEAAVSGEAAPGTADYQADKVLVRSNGILTYTAKDIAYHLWKFGVLGKDFRYKKFDHKLWTTHPEGVSKRIGRADVVVNVIDHRQHYPQLMVKQALQALGFTDQAGRLNHVGYGVVSLSPATAARLGVPVTEGKQAYPMSGRQGIGIKVSDFVDRMEQAIEAKRSRKAGLSSRAIAAAAIRYYLLRFHLQTEIVFDLDQATEVTGNTGVYLMYAYARACSIAAKSAAGQKGRYADGEHAADDLAASGSGAAVPQFALPESLAEPELALLRHISYWPQTMNEAIAELSPGRICSYAHELATLFNHFYAACPIMKAEPLVRTYRLWLTERFRETLQDALELLGLPTPSRM